MTLEQVMALDGRELNIQIAVKVGWKREGEDWFVSPGHGASGGLIDWEAKGPHDLLVSPEGEKCWLCPCVAIKEGIDLPDFSRDWTAAMQIRDWARGLPDGGGKVWSSLVKGCIFARTPPVAVDVDVLLDATPADYARAALLVSPS